MIQNGMIRQADIDAAVDLVRESLSLKVPQYKLVEFLRSELSLSIRKAEEFLKSVKNQNMQAVPIQTQ